MPDPLAAAPRFLAEEESHVRLSEESRDAVGGALMWIAIGIILAAGAGIGIVGYLLAQWLNK
jgi:hypothetical protein